MIKFFFTLVLFVSLIIAGAYIGKFHSSDHLEKTLEYINQKLEVTPHPMPVEK